MGEVKRPRYLQRGVGLGAIDGDESGRVAVTESFRSELFSVAGLAVDFLVGSVAGQHRIQGSFAVVALEAEFVVFLQFAFASFSFFEIVSLDGCDLRGLSTASARQQRPLLRSGDSPYPPPLGWILCWCWWTPVPCRSFKKKEKKKRRTQYKWERNENPSDLIRLVEAMGHRTQRGTGLTEWRRTEGRLIHHRNRSLWVRTSWRSRACSKCLRRVRRRPAPNRGRGGTPCSWSTSCAKPNHRQIKMNQSWRRQISWW